MKVQQDEDMDVMIQIEELRRNESKSGAELKDLEVRLAEMGKKLVVLEVERDKFKRSSEHEADLKKQIETKVLFYVHSSNSLSASSAFNNHAFSSST